MKILFYVGGYFLLAIVVSILLGKWLKGCSHEPEEFEHQDGPGDRGLLDR